MTELEVQLVAEMKRLHEQVELLKKERDSVIAKGHEVASVSERLRVNIATVKAQGELIAELKEQLAGARGRISSDREAMDRMSSELRSLRRATVKAAAEAPTRRRSEE